jgi:flagellar protein FliS
MTANPYVKYKTAASVTMTPLEILVALFDKCIIECKKAVDYMETGRFVKANESLKRVQNIVDELRFSLDMKYEVSQNLRELYVFYRQALISANYKKDPSIVQALIPQFQELKDTFSQIQTLLN